MDTGILLLVNFTNVLIIKYPLGLTINVICAFDFLHMSRGILREIMLSLKYL